MTNKPITSEEMKAYVDATWEKCQAEAWQEPVCGHGVRITKCPFCQPLEQKPVAWYCNEGLNRGVSLKQEGHEWTPLYTAPRREWQGLTDKEADELIRRFARYELLRAIEAKLREKNT